MRRLIILFAFLIFCKEQKAQYVTIPDPYFVSYLQTIVPSAMNGNQMDTTNVAVTTGITSIVPVSSSISNWYGLQFFKSLKKLGLSGANTSPWQWISYVPSTLDYLDCSAAAPSGDFSALPKGLDTLICAYSSMTSISGLPDSLKVLECSSCSGLSSINALPAGMRRLSCAGNHITSLPALPVTLTHLVCYSNLLTSLPSLPSTLYYLDCSHNQVTNLPSLPGALDQLDVSFNQLPSLPTLNANLSVLICNNNSLSVMPPFPSSLVDLQCQNNMLTGLPALPPALNFLACNSNQIASLGTLPAGLAVLICNNNQLTSLPPLPATLGSLYCGNNNIACFPTFPSGISGFSIDPNPYTCVPNYIPAMSSTYQNSHPVCGPNNPNGCPLGDSTGFGVKYYSDDELTIYPVPVSSLMEIKTSCGSANVQIQSVNGTTVLQVKYAAQPIDLSGLSPGVYFVEFRTETSIIVRKILKE